MHALVPEALDIIKRYEGFSATPYRCPAGKETVGFGHLVQPNESFASITEEEGEALLRKDLLSAEWQVMRYAFAPLNNNQYSALASLVFNCGPAPLTGTLGRELNLRHYTAAAHQFDEWVHAGGKVLEGLVKRRAEEKALFLKPVVAANNGKVNA